MGKKRDAPSLHHLESLVERLSTEAPATAQEWKGWTVSPISGGANNLIYRASGNEGDFAIKFTIRDSRDRAGREFRALQAVAEAGLDIAPKPILLDTESYHQPVVVQSWIDGEVRAEPPETEEAWLKLVEHQVAIHSIRPESVNVSLVDALIDARSVTECHRLVEENLSLLPESERPDHLTKLVERFQRKSFVEWENPPLVLCRVDCNTLNFIRKPTSWASVDWENSGWGDRAFELAALILHPAYIDVPYERWEWLIDTYSQLTGDASIAHRAHIYYQTNLVFWNIRWMRYRYEMPRGLDPRLVQTTAVWDETMQRKYEHYQILADAFV